MSTPLNLTVIGPASKIDAGVPTHRADVKPRTDHSYTAGRHAAGGHAAGPLVR